MPGDLCTWFADNWKSQLEGCNVCINAWTFMSLHKSYSKGSIIFLKLKLKIFNWTKFGYTINGSILSSNLTIVLTNFVFGHHPKNFNVFSSGFRWIYMEFNLIWNKPKWNFRSKSCVVIRFSFKSTFRWIRRVTKEKDPWRTAFHGADVGRASHWSTDLRCLNMVSYPRGRGGGGAGGGGSGNRRQRYSESDYAKGSRTAWVN